MTGQQIVTAILEQGGFDVDRPVALGWANEKYSSMVARARALKALVELGTTTNGDDTFAFPERGVSLLSLHVVYAQGAKEYVEGSLEQLVGIDTGRLRVPYREGVFVESFTEEGVRRIVLRPVPQEAGAPVIALVALRPLQLADSETSSPIVDEDVHDALVEGAIGLGLARLDENIAEADRYEGRYEAKVAELERREKMKVAPASAQMQISGYHF